MKFYNKKSFFIAFIVVILLILVINVVSRMHDNSTSDFSSVRTYRGMLNDNEEVIYKTKKYPFMDKITDMLKQSISDLGLDKTSSRDLSKENYCYTVGCFNTSVFVTSVVDFTANGSYSIGISTNKPFVIASTSYRFEYNGIDFIGDQILNGFFTDAIVQQPLNCEEVEEALYLDAVYPYDYIRWEFVVDCGEIVLAQCNYKDGCYDIINKQMLTMQEYNRRIMTTVPQE